MSGRYSDNANDQSGYDEETYDDGQGESYRDGEIEDGNPYAEHETVDPEDEDADGDDDEGEGVDGDRGDNEEDGSEEDGSEEGSEEGSYEDEYDEEAYAEDHDTEKNEYEEEERSKFCLWCLCCFCLLLIIIAVLLGILLPRRKNSEMAPTMAPTFSDGNGSNNGSTNPASDSVPPQISGTPNGDTSIYKSGPLRSEPQGEENIMLVQNDSFDDPEFPDTYALMNWYWDEAGYPWFNEDDLAGYQAIGLLCMEHIPNTNAGNEEPTIYSFCRLPSTFPGEDLETAPSTGFNYIMPTDCMGQETIDFDVRPNDETVCVDVSPLIDAYPPFVSSQTSPTSRGLQENNFQNMLFMLHNTNDNTRSSDEFYTKQSGARSPTLKLSMTPRSGNSGSSSGSDNGNESGSGNESENGNGDASPSGPSVPGDDSPTVDPNSESAPTISPAPTGESMYEPCGVCGQEASDVALSETFPVAVPADIAPDEVEGSASCAELENLCLAGKCKPQVCAGFVAVREDCGCFASGGGGDSGGSGGGSGGGGPTFCGVCPANTFITKPNENVKDAVAPFVDEELLALAGDEVTCASIEEICKDGNCSAEVCLSLPDILGEACGCEVEDVNNPVFTPPPVGPTEPPSISPAPTVSPGPTYKAEEVPCGICGIGPTPNPLRDDVPITVPDHLAPPQIKDGEASCAELEGYCQGGYCKRLTCRVLAPIRGICGCPNPYDECSICGPGRVIANTDPTLTLDASLAIPGYDNTISCGDLENLCSLGYCSPNQCSAFVDQAAATCGCQDTVPDFSTPVTTDTTIYKDGPLQGDSFGTEDTMLVQKGAGNEELPSAYSLLQFTITDNEWDKIKGLGFGDHELCLTHVEKATEDPEIAYTACIVPNLEGNDVEPVTGQMINYSTPDSCTNGDFSTFTVSPTTGRICTMVTKMFKDNVKGPGIVTFMVDASVDADPNQSGDRFYTSEDQNGRAPTLQIVDRPFE